MNDFIGSGHKFTCELPPLPLQATMSSCVTRHRGFAKRERYIAIKREVYTAMRNLRVQLTFMQVSEAEIRK